jgi:L-threonylcarbamoyladenylate synthase
MIATRILRADPEAASLPGAGEAAAILARDGLAVYPTDTYYGLGGNALSAAAVEKVFRLKGRGRGKPLSIVVGGLGMVERLTDGLPPDLFPLAAAFWPGPLTLVLKAGPALPEAILGSGGTIALRVPAVAWLRAFLDETGFPLTATSANLSGAAEVDDPAEARRLFEGRVEILIDGGKTPGGVVSTIVDLSRGEPGLLRPGAVAWDRILAALRA